MDAALKKEKKDNAEYLLNHGASLSKSALCVAVKTESTEMVRLVLARGGRYLLTEVDEDGKTARYYADRCGTVLLVRSEKR